MYVDFLIFNENNSNILKFFSLRFMIHDITDSLKLEVLSYYCKKSMQSS